MTREEAIEFLYTIADELGLVSIEERNLQDGEKMREAIEVLSQESKWIPVYDPLKELPKDRMLLVTVESKYSYRYVTELCYDMTEWSDIDAAENAIAYQDKPELPEPYNPEKGE